MAVVVPNFTVLVPCVVPKFVPVMLTDVPEVPEVGLSEVICGAVALVTEKVEPLLTLPFTVTVTLTAPAAMLGTLA